MRTGFRSRSLVIKEESISSTVIPIILGLFATAGAFLVPFMTAWINHQKLSANPLPDLTFGLCVSIVSLQINELRQARKMTPKLAVLERSIGMGEDKFFGYLADVITVYESIEDVKKEHPRCRRFYEEKEELLFTVLIHELKALSEGHLEISKERELRINEELFVDLPRERVRAVSYQDDEYWVREEGIKFLKAQLNSKHDVSRIFILADEDISKQKAVVLGQDKTKICVCVLNKKDAIEPKDFVIYDDYAVRYAGPPDKHGSKTAWLTVNPYEVRRYIRIFEEYETASSSVENFFKLVEEKKRTVEAKYDQGTVEPQTVLLQKAIAPNGTEEH